MVASANHLLSLSATSSKGPKRVQEFRVPNPDKTLNPRRGLWGSLLGYFFSKSHVFLNDINWALARCNFNLLSTTTHLKCFGNP